MTTFGVRKEKRKKKEKLFCMLQFMQKSLKLCWEIKQVGAAIVKWLSHETGPLLVDKSSSKSRQKSLAFVVKEKAFTTKILTLSSKISISCGKLYIFQHTVFFVRSNHQNKALIASSKGVHSLGVRSLDVCSIGAIQTECAIFSVSWTHFFFLNNTLCYTKYHA